MPTCAATIRRWRRWPGCWATCAPPGPRSRPRPPPPGRTSMLEAAMTRSRSDSALLRHYEARDGAREEMLRAAGAGDWDSVCRLEGACAVVIARLQELARR